MSEFARDFAKNRKPPVEAKPVRRITRQRRARMNEDAEYLALRDIYLEQNPACVWCGAPASQVHHIVKGVAGRARSLLNSDTWLGVCGQCHEIVDGFEYRMQLYLKVRAMEETVERLRR